MQKVEVQFQFPDAEDRVLFQKVKWLEDLKRLLLHLKCSDKYKNFSIGYTIRDWDYSKDLQMSMKMSIYFTCCINRYRNPAIHYLSKDGEGYKLQQRSTYIHHHYVKKFVPENISYNQSQNNRQVPEQSQNLHKDKNFPTKNQEQSQQSYKKSLESQQQQQRRKQLFQFPSKEQLKRIQTIVSRGSVLSSIGNFAKVPQFKSFSIRFQSIIHEQISKQGFVIFHLIIGFKCCKGINENLPFMHYVKKGTDNFHLIDFNLKHDHLNGLCKNIIGRQKKMINKLLCQILSKRQNNFYDDHFQDFSSYDQNNLKTKQQIQNEKKIMKKTFDVQQKNKNFLYAHKQSDLLNQINGLGSLVQQNSYLNKDKISEQKINQLKPNYQNNSKKLSLDGMEIQEIPKKLLIFSQLQKYSQKVSTFILQKQWKHRQLKRNPQEMESQSQGSNQQVVRYRIGDRKIWTECILQILKYNDIQIIEIETHKYNQFLDKVTKFENLLFVNKLKNKKQFQNKKISQNLYQTIEVYIGIYPIQVATKSEEMSILVAYTLTSQSNPNLLWFYVTKKNNYSFQSLQKIFEQNNDSQSYYKVLKQSIEYFDLKRVNFIYTSIDHKLLKALDKICQMNQYPNSEFKFSSLMHFSCLQIILDDLKFPQDQILEEQIRARINNFSNQEKILSSYNLLKNLINEDDNGQDMIPTQKVTNPQIIFETYQEFTKPFSNIYKKINLLKFRFSLFFSNFYDLTGQNETENPFTQLDQIFNHFDEFNNFAQAFIFILKTFDSTLRKVPQLVSKKRIIPFEIKKVKNQPVNLKKLSAEKEKLHDVIKSIFAQPAFELMSIPRECPKYISMTIQDLIIAANELLLKNLPSSPSQPSEAKFYFDQRQSYSRKTFKVSFINETQKKNFSQNDNKFFQNEQGKKWSCTCNFYRQTGIPCQHQILAAIQNKNSLYKEINSCWKKKK